MTQKLQKTRLQRFTNNVLSYRETILFALFFTTAGFLIGLAF